MKARIKVWPSAITPTQLPTGTSNALKQNVEKERCKELTTQTFLQNKKHVVEVLIKP